MPLTNSVKKLLFIGLLVTFTPAAIYFLVTFQAGYFLALAAITYILIQVIKRL
jgi:hypothetical protein